MSSSPSALLQTPSVGARRLPAVDRAGSYRYQKIRWPHREQRCSNAASRQADQHDERKVYQVGRDRVQRLGGLGHVVAQHTRQLRRQIARAVAFTLWVLTYSQRLAGAWRYSDGACGASGAVLALAEGIATVHGDTIATRAVLRPLCKAQRIVPSACSITPALTPHIFCAATR